MMEFLPAMWCWVKGNSPSLPLSAPLSMELRGDLRVLVRTLVRVWVSGREETPWLWEQKLTHISELGERMSCYLISPLSLCSFRKLQTVNAMVTFVNPPTSAAELTVFVFWTHSTLQVKRKSHRIGWWSLLGVWYYKLLHISSVQT